MCGISGFTGLDDPTLARRMADALTHRGPDDAGVFADGGVCLGFRRLSIIDRAGGHQPLSNEDGTVWVAFNGEIYNYQDLRGALARAGHRFATKSDTETIVHAYEEHGLDFVDHLHGMFALAIWDAPKRRLVLARDRAGMKPLYYARTPGGVAFASEIKSLLLHPDVSREPDLGALRLTLSRWCSPGARTAFRAIRKVLPGTVMAWEPGEEPTVRRYWDPPLADATFTDEEDAVRRLRALLRESVRAHLMSEVPLGVLLSGGLDSSAIAAFAQETSDRPVNTFTFGYSDRMDEEDSRHAREVAQYLGTRHREVVVPAASLPRLMPEVVFHHDEPKVDPASFPTLAAARAIRPHATVILVGEGSDEQLGGYNSHRYFAPTLRLAPAFPRFIGSRAFLDAAERFPFLRPRIRLLEYAGALRDPNRALRILDSPLFTDRELEGIEGDALTALREHASASEAYAPYFASIGQRYELAPMHVELSEYIPNDICMKVDKMTMAASVEARVPFLHAPLMEFTARIHPALKTRGGVSKHLLRRALARRLPESVLRRRKLGIQVPIAAWVRENVDLLAQLAQSPSARKRGLLREEGVARVVARARQGRDLYSANQLLGAATMELWHRMYVDPDEWRAEAPGALERWA